MANVLDPTDVYAPNARLGWAIPPALVNAPHLPQGLMAPPGLPALPPAALQHVPIPAPPGFRGAPPGPPGDPGFQLSPQQLKALMRLFGGGRRRRPIDPGFAGPRPPGGLQQY